MASGVRNRLAVAFAGAATGQAVSAGTWCPSAGDFVVAYGNGNPKDGGWTVNGGGAVATKAGYNLLGGWVEFDIDLSGVQSGVNANIYTISPHIDGSFNQAQYCDGAKTGADWCLEVDWLESNGHCGGATTLHAKEGPGNDGCTAWGCRASYHYNGKTSFHMRIEYGTDGTWTTIRDGQRIDGGTLSPHPGGADWGVVRSFYESKGAVIYSSEWVGWVPVDSCGGNAGSPDGSHFTVSNMKIHGSVVQGPKPRSCATDLLEETTVVI